MIKFKRIWIGWKVEYKHIKEFGWQNIKDDFWYMIDKVVESFVVLLIFMGLFGLITRILWYGCISWVLILFMAPFMKDIDKLEGENK